MVAAAALVIAGKRIPTGELWGGRPARLMRKMTDAEHAKIDCLTEFYYGLSREHLAEWAGKAPLS